jgi:hypothetical protein
LCVCTQFRATSERERVEEAETDVGSSTLFFSSGKILLIGVYDTRERFALLRHSFEKLRVLKAEEFLMQIFTIVSALSLLLPLLAPASVLDPIGDTYGTGKPFDISEVFALTNGTSTTFEIRFASPVPAELDTNLWGAIEIDVDRNAATGKTSEIDYPTMNFQHGVDYVIGFYYDDEPGTAAILDVTKNLFFNLHAEYGPDYFRITVPLVGSNGDTRMDYAVGVGDGLNFASLYSDIAGNNHQLLVTETPEPSTWAVCTAGLGLVVLVRRRRLRR